MIFLADASSDEVDITYSEFSMDYHGMGTRSWVFVSAKIIFTILQEKV